jgi:WD40 repeat protein
VRRLVFRPRVAGTDARHLAPCPLAPDPCNSAPTEIKYNAEGDLLFSASKDHIINVWHSHNGERLGTYEGHNGSVWTVDVDCESRCPNEVFLWRGTSGQVDEGRAWSGRVRCSTAARGSAKARARSVGMASRRRLYL